MVLFTLSLVSSGLEDETTLPALSCQPGSGFGTTKRRGSVIKAKREAQFALGGKSSHSRHCGLVSAGFCTTSLLALLLHTQGSLSKNLDSFRKDRERIPTKRNKQINSI